jgi:RNA polymerase sigma factor (TIGR02999 family)
VYDELRRLAAAKLAAEPAGHTLDSTALVHESYLRLAGATGFETRSQFFRAAAESMRRILVDHARRKRADKRGGGGKRFDLAEGEKMRRSPSRTSSPAPFRGGKLNAGRGTPWS